MVITGLKSFVALDKFKATEGQKRHYGVPPQRGGDLLLRIHTKSPKIGSREVESGDNRSEKLNLGAALVLVLIQRWHWECHASILCAVPLLQQL